MGGMSARRTGGSGAPARPINADGVPQPEIGFTGAARALMPGKRVQFDSETWGALDLLTRDRMSTFQELADEAFRDLLKKYGRPTDLKTALRESVRKEKAASSAVSKKPPKRS
jgi:hypothetical protein